MAKRYQKDIKVVLPKSNPFRDIAVYGAGEEIIKALGGELADKGKQPDIVPTKNNPHYMKKSNKKGQSPRSILSPEQRMAMQFGWGGGLAGMYPNKYQYDFGGVLKSIGAGAYGIGEGVLDTVTLGATDQLTDAGYKGLQKLGGSSDKEIKQQNAIHGWGQTAGAVGGAVVNPGSLGTAISEGSQGLGQGISNTWDSKTAQNIGMGIQTAGGLAGMATGINAGPKLAQNAASKAFAGNALGKLSAGAQKNAQLLSMTGQFGSSMLGNMQNNSMPQRAQQQFQPQSQLPQQITFSMGGKLNKRGIPHRGTSEQMPYQTQMQSYPNLEFGNGEQMLAMGGELEDTEFAEGGIHIKPSKRGTFTAAATKHGKSVQGFASQVLANKENYSPAMVKKANFARNASKWKHAEGGEMPLGMPLKEQNPYLVPEYNQPMSGKTILPDRNRPGLMPGVNATEYKATYDEGTPDEVQVPTIVGGQYIGDRAYERYLATKGEKFKKMADPSSYSKYYDEMDSLSKRANGGFLNEPAEGVIERRNKNRSREPQEYATFEENFKHMYAQGGRMGAMGPMDVGNIYYADGGMLNEYNGERHENGGIPMGPNAEVEGGETSMKMGMGGEQDSTYIYSDRLKVPGKNYTFAEASKKIDSKYGRRTNDKLSDESKKRELNKLMGTQEQERAGLVNSAYETIAAYGGPIRKYAAGGTDPIAKTSSYYDFNSSPLINELNEGTLSVGGKPYNPEIVYRRQNALGLPYNQFEENRNARINSDLNPEPEPKKPNFIQRAQQNRQNKRLQKYESNPNTSLENRPVNKDFTQAEIDELMAEESMAEQPMAPMSPMALNAPPTASNKYNIPVKGITSQGSSIIPDQGGARSTVNPDGSITSDSGFGTGEQWTKGLGYGIQGASLLARQLQLSRGKQTPNKAFTMQRQVLNADPQLREADISAAIANRNIRDLGASTSSGGAMAGYLAAQAGRTRSKADIMSDLQNRQAQVDMTADQYNAMAGERAYDKNAADAAAQQTQQAQLFADMGKLGSGVTRDYLLGQSQEGLMGSMYNPYFKYNKEKGRNRYNTQYTG